MTIIEISDQHAAALKDRAAAAKWSAVLDKNSKSCVADTHTVPWRLFDHTRLSAAAADFVDRAAAAGDRIAVSSISIAEIVYLIEKNRVKCL